MMMAGASAVNDSKKHSAPSRQNKHPDSHRAVRRITCFSTYPSEHTARISTTAASIRPFGMRRSPKHLTQGAHTTSSSTAGIDEARNSTLIKGGPRSQGVRGTSKHPESSSRKRRQYRGEPPPTPDRRKTLLRVTDRRWSQEPGVTLVVQRRTQAVARRLPYHQHGRLLGIQASAILRRGGRDQRAHGYRGGKGASRRMMVATIECVDRNGGGRALGLSEGVDEPSLGIAGLRRLASSRETTYATVLECPLWDSLFHIVEQQQEQPQRPPIRVLVRAPSNPMTQSPKRRRMYTSSTCIDEGKPTTVTVGGPKSQGINETSHRGQTSIVLPDWRNKDAQREHKGSFGAFENL
ncbi:hypothetical protein C8R45DRAFT_1077908 [Mycena sanguinolenta]|nr:hypothetical protein C8R45DRAFT_1077908 [Mycena sanguinolenta]